MILLFGVMLLTLFLGMEIGTAMGFAGMVYILISWLGPAPIALTTIAQNFVYGVDSFPFLAMPMFILAGGLMNEGGVTYHLVRFSQALVGHVTGGMGNVSVVANMIVSGMTGSAVADASATGSVMIPAMKQEKYPPEMASAVIAASACIGPIVPPSIAFVLIGSMTGTSIGRLFLGGAAPACLMGVLLLITNYVVSKRKGLVTVKKFDRKELFRAAKDSALSILMPIVVVGSIVFGIATPTEAAGVAVAYALFLGFVVYRKLTLRSTFEVVKKCAVLTASVCFTVAGAAVISWVASAEQITVKMTEGLLSISSNPLVILFIINAILFVLGFPLEPLPLTMMLIPILFPVITKLGIDPVHFVVIFAVNTSLALITPPVGATLYIVSALGQTTVSKVSRAVIPYLIGLLIALVIITLWPGLTLWLPNHLMR
ncbi:MAG TPA: TRAP transporter large permease [Syntrophorhabdaceae bacterium]|nr:TRAP transporter large permease [Syntrophorhabdaceae bacterium]